MHIPNHFRLSNVHYLRWSRCKNIPSNFCSSGRKFELEKNITKWVTLYKYFSTGIVFIFLYQGLKQHLHSEEWGPIFYAFYAYIIKFFCLDQHPYPIVHWLLTNKEAVNYKDVSLNFQTPLWIMNLFHQRWNEIEIFFKHQILIIELDDLIFGFDKRILYNRLMWKWNQIILISIPTSKFLGIR